MARKKTSKAVAEIRPDTPYLDKKGAAAYLQATPWFIAAAIRTKKLPYIPLGKKFVLRRDDLDAFATKLRVAA